MTSGVVFVAFCKLRYPIEGKDMHAVAASTDHDWLKEHFAKWRQMQASGCQYDTEIFCIEPIPFFSETSVRS